MMLLAAISFILSYTTAVSSSCNWIDIDYLPIPIGICTNTNYYSITGGYSSKGYLCESEYSVQEFNFRGKSCDGGLSSLDQPIYNLIQDPDADTNPPSFKLGHCDISYEDDGDNTTNHYQEPYLCDYLRYKEDPGYGSIDKTITIATGVCLRGRMYGCNNLTFWGIAYSNNDCSGYITDVRYETLKGYKDADVERFEVCTKVTEMPQPCYDCMDNLDAAGLIIGDSMDQYLVCIFVMMIISFIA